MIPTIRTQALLLERVTSLVKLEQRGQQWWGCCPFHKEKTPSFMVDTKDQHMHCFSCGVHGDVIDWTMRINNISKGKAIKLLAGELGLEQPKRPTAKLEENPDIPNATAILYQYEAATIQLQTCLNAISRIEKQPQTGTAREELNERKSELDELTLVLRELDSELYLVNQYVTPKLWGITSPLHGSLGAIYLASRGINIDVPDLRFAEAWNTETKSNLPALVSAVRDHIGTIMGLHRTYLAPDGLGKAKLEKPKKMLGHCSGGAVRLCKARKTLAVTEGIETGLSVQQQTGTPTWAALSAPGMAALVVPPPPCGMEVVIYADNDSSGKSAAEKLKRRMESEGRYVTIKLPPEGVDFNDLLMRGEWI